MSAHAPRRVVRNAVVRMIGEIVAKVGSLAFYVTMARELGANGYGQFQFALALTGGLVVLAGFGTDELLAREVARERPRSGRLLADAVAVKLIGGVLMLGVGAIVANVGDYDASARLAIYVVGAGALIEALSKSWFSVFQGHERLDLVSGVLIVQRFATAAVGVIVLLAGGDVVAAACVYAGGSVLAVLAAEFWLGRLGVSRGAADPSEWIPLMRTAVPIGVIGLLMVLLLRIDTTMLSFLSGAVAVGIFSVASRLVEATQFLGSALAMAMLPWLARTEMGLARGYELALKAVNALLAPVSLVLVLFARPLVELLYGHQYDRSVLPLQLLGGGALLYGVNAIAAAALVARFKPGAYARALVPVLVIDLGLSFVLIPRYGADGAAFDALLASTLLALQSLWAAAAVTGSRDVVGPFAGPALASAAMTALVLALHVWWPAEAVLGGAVYVLVLGAFEWYVRRADALVFLSVLPGSRFRADRTTA